MNRQEEYIEPLKAAIGAGAAHVWKTNYEAGANAGWAAGWAAGWTTGKSLIGHEGNGEGIQPDSSLCDKHKSEVSRTPRRDKASPVSELQMTTEWAELFARGENNRKRPRTNEVYTEECDTKLNDVNLGGKAFERRRQKAEVLYGDATQELLQLEAELDANYQSVISKSGAQMWPIV